MSTKFDRDLMSKILVGPDMAFARALELSTREAIDSSQQAVGCSDGCTGCPGGEMEITDEAAELIDRFCFRLQQRKEWTMRFHEYKTLKQCLSEDNNAIGRMSAEEFYTRTIENELRTKSTTDAGRICTGEYQWFRENRPFYNIYPPIVRCLRNTSLELRPSSLGSGCKPTAICFPVGHEPKISSGKVAAMIVMVLPKWMSIDDEIMHDEPVVYILVDRIRSDGARCYSLIQSVGDEVLSEMSEELGDKVILLSLAVGIVLLARDERFCQPMLLNRDAGRKFATEAEKQVAIQRAIRNGKNGHEIGRDIECSPHMRRPHFAIRWCGKGGVDPRLVPISGSLVMKSKVFPIPTGYLD